MFTVGLEDPIMMKGVVYHSIVDSNFAIIKGMRPSLPAYQAYTVEQYMSILSTFFAPAAETELKRTEFLELRQRAEEGVISYLARKYALYQEAYPLGQRSERDFVSEALKGFYSNLVKRKVNDRSPISYADLLEKSTSVVANERRALNHGFGEATDMRGLQASSVEVTDAVIRNASGSIPMDIGEMERNPGRGRAPANAECYWCSSNGHFKRDCRRYLRGLPRVSRNRQEDDRTQRTRNTRDGYIRNSGGNNRNNNGGNFRQAGQARDVRTSQGNRSGNDRSRNSGNRVAGRNASGVNAVDGNADAPATTANPEQGLDPEDDEDEDSGDEVVCLGSPGDF